MVKKDKAAGQPGRKILRNISPVELSEKLLIFPKAL
jgi:hypothetical protein